MFLRYLTGYSQDTYEWEVWPVDMGGSSYPTPVLAQPLPSQPLPSPCPALAQPLPQKPSNPGRTTSNAIYFSGIHRKSLGKPRWSLILGATPTNSRFGQTCSTFWESADRGTNGHLVTGHWRTPSTYLWTASDTSNYQLYTPSFWKFVSCKRHIPRPDKNKHETM